MYAILRFFKIAQERSMKFLFVLIDGVGDVNLKELGWRTPLEYASTPFLDAFAGTVTFHPPLPNLKSVTHSGG